MQTSPARAAHHNDREIETLQEFDATVSARGTLAGYRLQAVDLTDRTRELLATDTAGAVFLGCPMRENASAKIRTDGALVFPPIPDLPFDPYRGHVYTPDELFASLDKGYEETPDALAYAWHGSRGEPTPMVLVNRAHWTDHLPAWPLLKSLARERPMESRIALVDRIEEAPEALEHLGG